MSKKVPEPYKEYIVCTEEGHVGVGRYGKFYWTDWTCAGEIVAWMPLPESYDPENCKNGRWTPVSEKNPDKSGEYLICGQSGSVMVEYFLKESGAWYALDEKDYYVEAWMPLPDTYR